jgi:rhodanese-related sulfurtransferase
MSKETTDTLGNPKKTNYALNPALTREAFIQEVLTGLVAPPAYFPLNVLMNIKGYDSIDEVLERGQHKLSAAAFEAAANETGALVLDTREAEIFAKKFIPNSINIGIDGSFAPWVGTLVPDIKQQILLVTEPGREEEVITRLARVGYDFCIGYLDGGIEAWEKAGFETDSIRMITADELSQLKGSNTDIHVLDVRKKSEYDSEHVLDAENAPLDFINEALSKIRKE